MNIDELKVRKGQLECELREDISGLLDNFKKDTGVSIESISVYMINIDTMGSQEKRILVNDVVCDISL